MRGQDFNMAIALKKHWQGEATSGQQKSNRCALFSQSNIVQEKS